MRKVLRDVYGTLDMDTGRRQYKEAFISIAKKNGKSAFLGGAPLHHLDQEEGSLKNVIGVATTREQAGYVFTAATEFIKKNPELDVERSKWGRFKVVTSSRTIMHVKTGYTYKVLACDGNSNDGVPATMAIVDETHRFRTKTQIEMYDAVKRSGRGKEEPLRWEISTAGDIAEPSVWRGQYNYAKQVISGAVKSPEMYALLYEPDQDRLGTDPEYWKSKEAQLAANPSHEDFGGFVTQADLMADLHKAVVMPDEQRKYFRFSLNSPSESESKLFMVKDWKANGAETKPLMGRDCSIGLDLSSSTDFTAMVLVFPDPEGGPETEEGALPAYDVLPFFWVPADNVPSIERKLGPVGRAFRRWVDAGLIQTTPGNVIDYRFIESKIAWAVEEFNVTEIDIDPWNAQDLVQRMKDNGYTVVEIPQGIRLSPAIKYTRDCVLKGQFRHGGHEVLAWNAACTSVIQDAQENLKLDKERRDLSRIDGIAALVTAMARAMITQQSVYASRGILRA